ncbi:hypothetical protein CDAR_618621 [Caerostris darwini]|uniref:Uncharacterized protein n=1 Tax=Caerostris darwini TaxID=1538125 RepID=A0AAV4WTF4_9ARAC|nr:hypothetical protein CDAR_618621 [Caerostris darwini]
MEHFVDRRGPFLSPRLCQYTKLQDMAIENPSANAPVPLHSAKAQEYLFDERNALEDYKATVRPNLSKIPEVIEVRDFVTNHCYVSPIMTE